MGAGFLGAAYDPAQGMRNGINLLCVPVAVERRLEDMETGGVTQSFSCPMPRSQTFRDAERWSAASCAGSGHRCLWTRASAVITIEMGQPDEAMRVFDVANLSITSDRAVLTLGVRPAICKPRHRADKAVGTSCCAPSGNESACCRLS